MHLKTKSIYNIFIILIVFYSTQNFAKNYTCPKNELYLHQQIPVYINKNCVISNTFYFNDLNIPNVLSPVEREIPNINIPKAQIN